MHNRQLPPGEALRQLRAAGIEIVREHTGDGTEIRCRCPDHADPDGHLYVNAFTGAGFCHKCGLRTHIDALCGPLAQAAADPRSEILAAAAVYYRSRLPEEARRYLLEARGLSPEVLDRFQVGWADGGLRRHLLEEGGFSADACLEAGVLKQDERGLRDFFLGRIVFPNTVGGRVVHLSGRALGEGEPKWLHIPGEITHPYNADALRRPNCLWVEAILDALSAACWDMPAAAGLGTHAKPEWAKLVPDGNRVIVTLDGDAAGSRGSLTIAELLGDRARIASLPPGMDPNDMLREGRREEFEVSLREAVDLLTFQISQVPADAPRTELPHVLADLLKQIAAKDPASAEAYLGVLKARFGLTREELGAYRRTVRELRSASRESIAHAPLDDVTYTAQLEGLVDLVEDEGEPAFLLVEGDGRLQVMRVVERDGQMLTPPPKDKIPWLLPRADEVLRHYQADRDEKLYDDLTTYHRAVSELPSDAHYEFLAAWDMHTHLLEEAQYSPELCFLAVPERGKTRTGKGMVYVAYRGIHVESLRDPYIVRFAEYFGGTIFFDVMGLWRKAEREGTQDVILGRYERGIRVPRVVYPERGPHRDTVYFSIFGPTVIGTNEAIHHILDTRGVTITMPETRRSFEDDITPEAARPLRERLAAFRARHLGKPLPQVRKPASGRLGDILRPLRQIVRLVRPDREDAFLAFVTSLQRERLQDKADTLEAELLRVLDGLRAEVSEGGLLPVRLVTQKLNEGRPDEHKVSDQKVGVRLRSLGFRKGTRSAEGATIQWDEEALVRAMEGYGLRNSTHSAHSTQSPALTLDDNRASAECVECVESGRQGGGSGAHTPPAAKDDADAGPDRRTPLPDRPCYACKGRRFWHSIYGPWFCSTCHPPGSPSLAAEWCDLKGAP